MMSIRRICIVDDDRDFADMFADLLRLEGHEVNQASTGEAAIERLRHEDYDLTFLDFRLPGMDGIETLREIRRMKPQAQVCLMTGYGANEILDQAMRNGARAVFGKPLELNRVLAVVDQG
jgi:DNA-binding NtrC family response regulator